jgi:zinc transport system substrate-binding protein
MKLFKYKYINIFLIVAFSFLSSGCYQANKEKPKELIAASNYPISFILQELTGNNESVFCIVPPGTSEHAFSLKPSDINKIENAKVIFYVNENLDSWISKINNENKIGLLDRINGSDMISYSHVHNDSKHSDHENEYNGIDPHFWTDPIIVRDLIPTITAQLIRFFPNDSIKLISNSRKLIEKLTLLDSEFYEILEPYRGKYVFLFHPSFLYFLKRYGLNYAGAVEEFPGKEPTIQYISEIEKTIIKFDIRALYREPQLPEKSLVPIASGRNLKILMLDPIGGFQGRNNYFDLMRFNAINIKNGFIQN